MCCQSPVNSGWAGRVIDQLSQVIDVSRTTLSCPHWLDCGLWPEVGTSLTILVTGSGYIRYSGEKVRNSAFGR